jgi:hypothetical protein
VAIAAHTRPIRVVLRDDDLRRSRLTVFFRLLLAIPHFVWLILWGIAAFTVSFVNWLAVLIEAEVPSSLHNFVAGYLRYATHLGAYLLLAANPYPGFRGRPGYPVDLEIDPPKRQGRWGGFFRLLLALPALLLAEALGGGSSDYGGVAAVAAFLAWFFCLALGRAPRGIRDLSVYALDYGAQAAGYLLLLTPRYPSSDPALAEAFSELPEHPVRIAVEDDIERSRLTVFLRLLLALPHLVWLLLWTIAVVFAAIAAWFAALVTGQVPVPLHRFLAAYVRYVAHVLAYVTLVGRRFPGFTGRADSYGINLEIAPRERQSRWTIFFRAFLALPAFIVSSAMWGVLFVIAFLGWFYALVLGRTSEGLRNLGVSFIRYGAQVDAYVLLVTGRYPYAAPVLRGKPPPEPETEPPAAPSGPAASVPGDAS